MKIYEGTYLTINFEEEYNRVVQFWARSPDNIDAFKKEMLVFTNLYKKYRPKQALWLQQNMKLQLDPETSHWIDQNVNIPCDKCGNEKLAFVVAEDVLAHLTTMNVFEAGVSIATPRHFATEKEARSWLDEKSNEAIKEVKVPPHNITYKGLDKEGRAIIQVKTEPEDISDSIKLFKGLIEESQFIKANIDKYTSLTKREKEVLIYYSKEQKHQEIADQLFLSLHTTRTHIRNIKRKLATTSFSELTKYTKAFGLK